MTGLGIGLGLGGFGGVPASVPLLDGSEADGTNLITGASDLDFTNWGVIAGTKTVNNIVAPNGATVATKFLEDVTNDRHGLYNNAHFTIVGGSSHTYSIYVKSITERYVQYLISGTGGIYLYADLLTGTITASGTVTPSGGTAVTGTNIQAAVNGFYKLTLTGIVDGATTVPFQTIWASNVPTFGAPLASNSPQFTGNTANGFAAWRPKVV